MAQNYSVAPPFGAPIHKIRVKYLNDDVNGGPSRPPGGKPVFKPKGRGRGDSEDDSRQSPEISDEPIPFVSGNGEDPDLSRLLPYLALGFAPQSPPPRLLEDAYMCGINALATGLEAVRSLLVEYDSPLDDHLIVEDIRAMLEGHGYEVEARNLVVEIGKVDEATDEPLEEYLQDYLEANVVGIHQLIVLMRMINTRLDSKFNIGFITEGFRGRYEPVFSDPNAPLVVSGDRIWNPDFVQPHEVYFQQQYPYGPTIWLHNDNAGKIKESHEQGVYYSSDVSHWEAMTPKIDPRAREAINRWNLEAQTRALVDQGLAMIRENIELEHENDMEMIYAGHFATLVPTPPDTPTEGTAVVDLGGQHAEIAIPDLKHISYTPNTGLPIEPPIYKPGIPNFRILLVKKGPPKGARGRYPIIKKFNISRGECFHVLPDFKVLHPKVRRIEGGETGEIDNTGKFMGVCNKPWGLESTQRLVAYPHGMMLPLARLESDIEGVDGFEKEEVVLVTERLEGLGEDGEWRYCVYDIDGEFAVARGEQLVRWATEAFSLRFDKVELKNKLKMLTVTTGFQKNGEEDGEEDVEEDGKGRGKGKAASKKNAKGKEKAVEEVPMPKASKRTKKTEASEQASPKKTGKRKAVTGEDENDDDDDLSPPEPSKKKAKASAKKAGKKAGKRKMDADEEEEDEEDVSQPGPSKKKPRVSARETGKNKAVKDEDEEEEEALSQPEVINKKAKSSTKKGAKRKAIDDEEEDEEDEEDDAPEPGPSRKRARFSVTTGGKGKAAKNQPPPKGSKKSLKKK
ncbi:hypothetical protein ONS95_002648 [Cadophora gregata]|uniref:uncharacterized protein n=1 Tax=Cadophora gregata TaxID=51156 RepID=UPI0026DCEF70|nr:uncharacterized protein ONS95_002648 [Cadophora gregata]KAK0109982.1 hypothetical protein ONS95_002648 [Cadophora gregata]KAK0110393.1 hypothetical protein ONS96_002007 [Cadophora gregata f. sp. sojae]